MKKILNIYIKRPLLYDILLGIAICLCINFYFDNFNIAFKYEEDTVKSIISDNITNSISLAGFVLASLTIVVTFKDNISRKVQSELKTETDVNNQLTGLETLFSSKHYKRIVGIFTSSAFILLLVYVVCSVLKAYLSLVTIKVSFYIAFSLILIVALTILRSLLILYRIIKLQVNSNQTS